MSVIRKVSPKGVIKKEEPLVVPEGVEAVQTEIKEELSEKPSVSRVDTRESGKSMVRTKRVCAFCVGKTSPHYYDASGLRKYISDRGRIFSRGRTGACAKHQRSVGAEIKRARHLSLLPFTVRV